MRSREEILEAIEYIRSIYTEENIPEFVRGQYSMLMWMLEGKEQ